jgi:hypothetical protein
MLNPFNPEQNPDPTGRLAALRIQKRLLKNIQTAGVDDRIFQVVQDAFEEALKKEQFIVLPDGAKKYLLAQIMKQVLVDMAGKLNDKKAA